MGVGGERGEWGERGECEITGEYPAVGEVAHHSCLNEVTPQDLTVTEYILGPPGY